MNRDEMWMLRVGSLVRNIGDEHCYVVTGNYGDRATAVRTVDITNLSEWEFVSAARPMHSIHRKWELLRAGEVEFGVDADGTLWKGPTSIEDTIHYGRMQGFNDDGTVMWYGCRSDPPDVVRMLNEDDLATFLFDELKRRQ